MGLFRRKRVEAPVEEQRSTVRVYPYFGLPNTYSGESVTIENAVRTAAVAACVRVIKTTVSGLPVDEVITQGKIRRPVEPSQIVRAPSGRTTQRVFVAQLIDSLLRAGNAYAQVAAYDKATFRPTQVETIDPACVTWNKMAEGVLVPYVDGKPRDIWPIGDLIHIPATAFIRAGVPVADSPVELAKEAIGAAIAAERFGAQFFGEGIHPTTMFKTDQELDRDAAMAAKNGFVATMRNREPVVMGSGWEIEKLPVDPNDSQFIDLLRFEVEQACRFWGVPPSMVYAAISGQNITYANVTETDLSFLKYSITPWLLDIEDAWSSWLTQPRRVKFNVSALLRMDDLKRHELYERRLKSKTIAVNEVRALEDEPPFPGDEFNEPGVPGGGAPTPPTAPAKENPQ